MDGDTPVNTGVVAWPSEDSAWVTVRRMQLKLHRWASEDRLAGSVICSIWCMTRRF